MTRGIVVMAWLAGAVCAAVAGGQDKDPVKDRLFAAKVDYDGAMREYRKLAGEWFDRREEDARKDGNKKLVDQVKGERDWFDESGGLLKGAPPTLSQKPVLARKALEAAYAQAVKDYVKGNQDVEAAATEAAWKAFVKASAIDLLAFVDPKAHAVAGEWKMDGKTLTGGGARIQLPYEPGEEYDLEVSCRRVSGNDGFCVGLVAGGRPVIAVIDGWSGDGHMSGLDLVDRRSARNNTTTVKGQLLKADQDHTLMYSVRSGRIDVSVNGKVVTTFNGNFARLSIQDGWGVPNKKALFITANTPFIIDRIAVLPMKGQGTVTK
jgi:hypothetical protein